MTRHEKLDETDLRFKDGVIKIGMEINCQQYTPNLFLKISNERWEDEVVTGRNSFLWKTSRSLICVIQVT